METLQADPLPDGIRELPIVAGDLALDFANTVDDPRGPLRFDHVGTYRALLVWAQRIGLPVDGPALLRQAEQDPRAADTVVRRGAELRNALNSTFGPVTDQSPPDRGWLELRPFVVESFEHLELVDGQPHWHLSELESPLWPVAHAAYELLGSPRLARVKRCAGCPWLFVDGSKNGSRRWCSMEICGTNQKITRYVAKRASRRQH